MLTELSFNIEDYLHKYEYLRYHHIGVRDRYVCSGTKYRIWYISMRDIGVALLSINMEHTLNFNYFI